MVAPQQGDSYDTEREVRPIYKVQGREKRTWGEEYMGAIMHASLEIQA
jgi:hypothetical protein